MDDRTACVLVSSVLYETAEIVPDLDAVAAQCTRTGARMLVDAYHHLNAVPFDLTALGLQDAFVTGGGYKYCQLGEGNAFLRVPPECRLRPALTGWFAEFDVLDQPATDSVHYGEGAAAFAGSTYDPVSHYRGAAVFAFHDEHGLTAQTLHSTGRRQVALLRTSFESLDIAPSIAHVEPMPDERRAGFLAIRTPRARTVVAILRERGVFVDARGDLIRVGPAPYLRDDQLTDAVAALGDVLTSVATHP